MEYHTVEPPYKGHFGTRHVVLYIEVVLSLEVQNTSSSFGTIKPVLYMEVFSIMSFIQSLH